MARSRLPLARGAGAGVGTGEMAPPRAGPAQGSLIPNHPKVPSTQTSQLSPRAAAVAPCSALWEGSPAAAFLLA